MWTGSRDALALLDLDERERILDVGCGTGALTSVLVEESEATVIGLDADPTLLQVAREQVPVVVGDALRLPVRTDAVNLVVCQALLINLPDPASAVTGFARVSTDTVAAIEPDNAAVTVESTVQTEQELERRARSAYLEGIETDVSLGGSGTQEAFAEAGLTEIRTCRYEHVRTVEPPYSEPALRAARRKASGEGLASDRSTMLAGGLDSDAYERLRSEWRSMGREVIEQIQEGEYRRREVVPFYVTVGLV
jgi:SAM-dependent methyltransferase